MNHKIKNKTQQLACKDVHNKAKGQEISMWFWNSISFVSHWWSSYCIYKVYVYFIFCFSSGKHFLITADKYQTGNSHDGQCQSEPK